MAPYYSGALAPDPSGVDRFIALLAQGVAATAAEVKVMAGAAMSGAFGELVPQFERATGHKIVIQYGSTGTFKKQIEAGEAFDLVIIGSDGVDDLIKQGKIAGDTRVDIARVGHRRGCTRRCAQARHQFG